MLLYYYTVAQRPTFQIMDDAPYSALWKSMGFTDKRGNKTRDYT